MAEILGLGGVFFKSEDRVALAAWYKEHLGLDVSEWQTVSFKNGGEIPYTVWSPFSKDTEYLKPSERDFMINFVVDDVAGVLERARQGGAAVIDEIVTDEFGEFGWFMDPDGNKIELWKPAAES